MIRSRIIWAKASPRQASIRSIYHTQSLIVPQKASLVCISRLSTRSGKPQKAKRTDVSEEEEESSWAFGGGVNSQGGPASETDSDPHSDHKIEFIVEGNAGKGAVPNYGKRRRYTHDTDSVSSMDLYGPAHSSSNTKDAKYAQQYRHEYAPTARSPKPLPHHTYFSSPSSSFNDDAAATAAGMGPVGVGGPRSGLGSGAGTHEVINSGKIKRKKSALILPGQGSQYVGMTDDIFRKYRAARQVWTVAEEALEYGPHLPREIQTMISTTADPQQRERFEEELAKSAEWDPFANRHSSKTKGRNPRGWLRDLVFKGDQLNLTRAENAQPSIMVSSLAILAVLRQEFPVDLIANHIDYVAGHGTGIYAALCAAGSVDLRDGVRLLRHRGLSSSHFVANNKILFPEGCKMPESVYETWAFANAGSGKGAELLSRTTIGIDAGGVPPTNSASDADVVRNESNATPQRGWKRTQMSGCMIRPGKLQDSLRAIEKIAADIKAGKVESVSTDEVVEVANINSSLQIVLSGTRVGVSLASDQLRQLNLGARAVNLPVSGPYHSSLMQEGAEFLIPSVESLPLRGLDPEGFGRGYSGTLQLVSSNQGARLLNSEQDIRDDLSGALAKPVMWLQSIERMLENGVQRFICLGPGRACAHLLSKELAYRDRIRSSQGHPTGDYEVWSINSVEDVEQIGSVLSRLSAEEGSVSGQQGIEHGAAL
jgi:malonyl CoA-acyl carrier protein transacylase